MIGMQNRVLDPFYTSTSAKYEKIGDLGSGAFGSVKLARIRSTNDQVAVKLLKRGPATIDKYVERELCNHRALVHDHIIRFYEAFLTDEHLCIVMEYARGGNLFDHIKRHRALLGRGFTEDDARWFFWQLMVAVDYIHKKDICNRDIKLENTLLSDDTVRPLLKLCDFGFSKNERAHSAPHSRVGTIHYMAPEVVTRASGMDYDGKAADIWSCGVMLYAMLFRSYPFSRRGDTTDMEVAQRIRHLDFTIPNVIPWMPNSLLPLTYECRDLLSKMLHGDPSQRITMTQIFQHSWFLKGVDPRVLTMNSDIQWPVDPDLQSEDELKEMVQMAAAPREDVEFSQQFEVAFSEEQEYARTGWLR